MTEPIRYLSRTQIAHRIGVTPGALSSYKLPEENAWIGDVRGWLPATIDAWHAARPGRGNHRRATTGPAVGDPDGHGTFGQIDDDGHSVLCHECGKRYRNLGLHVKIHGLTAAEYKAAHGLFTGQTLIPADLAEDLSAATLAHPTSLAALAEHHNPDAARAGMTPEGQSRPQRAATRARVGATSRLGRPITPAEVEQLAAADTIEDWVTVARGLTDTGASVRGIAAAVGLPAATAHARLRRNPPTSARLET